MHAEPATERELEDWLRLRMALYPDTSEDDNLRDMNKFFANPDRNRCFVGRIEEKTVGFIEVTIRYWAEGCDTPNVGYVEAIFVDEFFRNSGVARVLVQAAEGWAAQKGAKEIASDAEVNNQESLGMHAHMNYREVGRSVHFKKDLP